MTERTISAEERAEIVAWRNEAVAQQERYLRLSAWVSGDVARARELAEQIVNEPPPQAWADAREIAAEIVALLTPPEGEGVPSPAKRPT